VKKLKSTNINLSFNELGYLLRNNLRFFYYSISIFFLIGLTVALTNPVEYRTDTTLIPENSNINAAGTSSFLQSFGISNFPMISEQEYFDPLLFKNVTNSKEFFKYLMYSEVLFSNNKKIVPFEYFMNEFRHPIYDRVFRSLIRFYEYLRSLLLGEKGNIGTLLDDRIISLNKDEQYVADLLKKRIELTIDEINGTFSVRTEMPDPLGSVSLAILVTDYLIEFSNKYQTKKSTDNLVFIKERYDEVKKRYDSSSYNLYKFIETNRNLASETYKIEEEKLRNEYNISFGLFKSLSEQVEQNKIKVKEKVPVFTVLSKPYIPLEKSKPQRILILIFSFFLGFFLPFSIIFITYVVKNYEKISL
jgi:hypothetical protein